MKSKNLFLTVNKVSYGVFFGTIRGGRSPYKVSGRFFWEPGQGILVTEINKKSPLGKKTHIPLEKVLNLRSVEKEIASSVTVEEYIAAFEEEMFDLSVQRELEMADG